MAGQEDDLEKQVTDYEEVMRQVRATEAARAGLTVDELRKRRRGELVDRVNSIYGAGAARLINGGEGIEVELDFL